MKPKVTIGRGEIYAKAVIEFVGDDKSEMKRDIERTFWRGWN